MTLAISNLTMAFRVLAAGLLLAFLCLGAAHALYGILGPFGRLYGLRKWVAWRRQRPQPQHYWLNLRNWQQKPHFCKELWQQNLNTWRQRKPGRL